jgi:hypothetical protein
MYAIRFQAPMTDLGGRGARVPGLAEGRWCVDRAHANAVCRWTGIAHQRDQLSTLPETPPTLVSVETLTDISSDQFAFGRTRAEE